MGQQARERIGGAVGQLTGGNQTGNQSTGVLGQLGDQPRSMLAPSLMSTNRTQDAFSQPLTTTTNGTAKPPNIVFILVDNLPPELFHYTEIWI